MLVSMEPDTVPEDILELQAYKDFVNNAQKNTVVTLGMNF